MRRIMFFVLAFPLVVHAQLREVQQVIYGMDCAPCARGVEASLQRLEGVQSVKISLNNGTADIRLAPDNRQRLEQIRQRISDNGFSPKDARVIVSGMLREKDGSLFIETAFAETFVLDLSPEEREVQEQVRRIGVGKSITISGVIPEAKKAPFRIQNIRVVEGI